VIVLRAGKDGSVVGQQVVAPGGLSGGGMLHISNWMCRNRR